MMIDRCPLRTNFCGWLGYCGPAESDRRKGCHLSKAAYRLGLALVTGSAFAWSTAGLFSRLVTVDNWTMVAWRGLFGALGVFVILLVQERGRVISPFLRLGWRGVALGLFGAAGMTLFVTSLRYTTVAHASVIYATIPFMAAAAGWLALGELPGRPAVVASTLALGGVALMVGFSSEGSAFGDMLAFGMTACMAIVTVMMRMYPQIPVMPAVFLSAFVSGLIAVPEVPTWAIDGREMLLLALFGLTNSALGLALFTYGSRYLPAIETALIGALDAPLAPLWVWLVFGETPGVSTLVGGAIVFVAVMGHIAVGAMRSGVPAE